MLDCCRSLDDVRDKGITISEFGCLATCNGLQAKVHRADLVTKEQFLEHIIRTSQCDDEVLVVSYFRGTLGQTGTGHFSPLGGYCAATNSVLVFDVARFKYPPYWCPVDLIWDAMLPHDPVTDKPRGYVLMSRSPTEAALPKLNLTTTTVARLVHHLTVEFPHKLANDPELASLAPVDVLARALAREVVQLCTQMEALKCAACDEVVAAVIEEETVGRAIVLRAIRWTKGHSAHAEANEAA
ncbi:hypothetical protein, variant 2 [Allomyces macrogynus ATCC 38327]|nr:hypothetical protein, variant 2 [Allomyces macrogynus ATCC 38327]|eukprot:KNE60758.1 hypothetical protein, variant 2 [Allomyces macrogynus ATCC 38327]